MKIPQSAIAPFEPLGLPNMTYARKINDIEIAITQAFENMLFTFQHLSNKTPKSKAIVSGVRNHIMCHLRTAANMAGANKVYIRSSGDGTMIPIEYVITFDGHTRKLIQYVD